MMAAWPGSTTPVTGAPYSGVETKDLQRTLADGNEISRQDQTKVYRDSQGRIRMERTPANAGNGAARTHVTIFDPVAGYAYMLVPSLKKAMKMPLPANHQSAPPQRPNRGKQVQTEDLGTQTINGLAATGTRVTTTIPAGAIGNTQPIQTVKETWISTALKVPVQIKTTDPRLGKSTVQLTNVVQSEPDPALFQVPPDYTVTDRPAGRAGMNGMRQRFNRNQ